MLFDTMLFCFLVPNVKRSQLVNSTVVEYEIIPIASPNTMNQRVLLRSWISKIHGLMTSNWYQLKIVDALHTACPKTMVSDYFHPR